MPAKSNRLYAAISTKDSEEKKVKRGHLNYLLRTKKVVLNTDENQKLLQIEIEKRKILEKEKLEKMQLNAKAIENITINIEVAANEDDKLYESVNEKMIVTLILEQHKIEIHSQQIILDSPIKNFGEHLIHVKFIDEIIVPIKLNVAKKKNI